MAECRIVTTRIVKASREAVWQAWTNPILLAQWWGPKGFRNTFYEFDLRSGAPGDSPCRRVIVGEADVMRPEHAVEMFRLLPHAQLAVLPARITWR